MSSRAGSCIRCAGSRNQLVNIELSAVPGVKRANARLYVAAQCVEVVYVAVELAAEALLIRFREFLGLCNCFFERLRWHTKTLSRLP